MTMNSIAAGVRTQPCASVERSAERRESDSRPFRVLNSDLAKRPCAALLTLRSDAQGQVLPSFHGRVLDGDVRAYSYLALHLGVFVHHKLHGLLIVAFVHFQREGVSAVSNRSYFAGDLLGGIFGLPVG